MANLDTLDVHSRTMTALFDTRDAADKAARDLQSGGIPREHISIQGREGTAGTAAAPVEDMGFWESLKDLFLPEEDRHVFAEGLNRGGFLLSVRTDEKNYTRVLDILDREGTVDLDQREKAWRAEGWSGFQAEAANAGAMGATTPIMTPADTAALTTGRDYAPPTSGAGLASAMGTPASAYQNDRLQTRDTAALGRDVDANRDEVIPVYEEQLRVGKRDVSHGRVRVRSYVVETPVNEQVSLRSESVQVERHPVDRALAAGETAFQDRVIEVEERAEEAVISKEARIKEEITLRKTAEDTTQTINDSVRHTEVEIDDQRGKSMTAATTGFSPATDQSRIVEHMDVISADGTKIGKVDHLDGPSGIKLTKSDSPDHQHHHVPFSWIDHVDQHVHLKKTLAEIKNAV